ncbi:MAG: PAS domain-containing protein [Alphaproteobacteria bacterium]|jgi:hypothetical protein|nr:PAS domain-containing protein [Alphaproteobacteria bacterium]
MLHAVDSKLFMVDPGLQVESAHLKHLLAYWRGKCDGARLPSRAAIDPVELSRHLGHLYLIDVIAAPLSFRYRLVGVHIADTIAADPTGFFLDEAVGTEALPDRRQTLEWVVTARAPLRLYGRTRLPGRSSIGFEALKLPLSSDGDKIDVVLCTLRFEEARVLLANRIPSFAHAGAPGLAG